MNKLNQFYAALFAICHLLISNNAIGQSKEVILSNFERPILKKNNIEQPKTETIKPINDGKVSINKTSNYYSIEKEDNFTIIHFSKESNITAKNFFNIFTTNFNLTEEDSFVLLKQENDNINFTHYRYQQYYKGIFVTGGEYLLHEKNNLLVSANGNIFNKLNIAVQPKITKELAILNAIKNVGAEKYQWENKSTEDFLKSETNDVNATNKPKAELVIAPTNGIYSKENFRLCYKINIASEKPYDIQDVFVDAQSGEIINKISKISHTEVTGTASTLYSGSKSIKMDSNTGGYRLRETTRPIQTLNMINGTNYSNAVDFSNSSATWNTQEVILNSIVISTVNNNWEDFLGEQISNGGAPDLYIEIRDAGNNIIFTKSNAFYENTFPAISINTKGLLLLNGTYTLRIYDADASSSDDLLGTFTFSAISGTTTFSANGTSGSISRSSRNNPALDAHWAMEKTYDFYLTQLSRNSFNNTGGLIKNYVHTDLGFNNAFWNGTAMSYGDGDGSILSPLTSIDVVGHEFTHAVVTNTANLAYQGESGALNESFADIFGTAIEFYGSSSPNWTMGENITLISPYYIRSMSNPNNGLSSQPDTYTGTYWANTSSTQDNGGVHTNSGVQNFWYYLLSQGGSGTNDKSNSYTVSGIGMTQATQIAYRNLSYYLTSSSNYTGSYYGSLQAAQDLFGNPSTQYSAVRAAWFAVGIGNSATTQCIGTTNLTAMIGTFSDGSGNANYQNNLNCSWLIQPTGADSIAISFSSFKTEANYDTVFVYAGPTSSSPLLLTWWGNTLPPNVKSTVGAMFVRFSSDVSGTDSGWTANYVAYGTSYCNGGNQLTAATGSFTDGSGTNNYGNNSLCYWLITPPCATSVSLSFSSFSTELGYDFLNIYNGNNTAAPLLLSTSGTSLPSNVTATSGQMLVVFSSDYLIKYPGFAASYTSTGTPYCSGTTTLNTSDYGTISDGSGVNNYCNNMNCSWLIQPPQATSVKLTFTSFKTESPSTDGLSIYDAVEVYDGTSASATLLGKFSGSSLPPSITSSGGSMYIRFFSDNSVTDSGWSAYYTSTTPNYCSGVTILTSTTGSFTDGSGTNNYGNNASCKWLIQPTGVSNVSLSFSSFDTELNYDGIIVYDGADTSSPKLGVYTGTTLPPMLTSTGGSMLVWFLSDEAFRSSGWDASYNSTSNCGTTAKPNPMVGFTINNPTQCLSGNSFQYNDTSRISSGTITRIWSFGDVSTGSNILENKTYGNANTYNVKLVVTSNNGCKDSITKTIVVNSQPVVTISAGGSTNFCDGDNVILSGNTGTGFIYQWKNNGTNVLNATSPNYTASLSGNYKLVVTNSNSCADSSSAITVNVNSLPPIPTISSSATSFCKGKSLLLSCANTGYSYQWKKDGTAISGANNVNLTVFQPGNYTVEITNTNSCKSVSSVSNIKENASPVVPIVTANGATTFCEGGQVTLSTLATGVNYQWQKDSLNISGANSNSIIANTSGNYSLEVSNITKCKSNSETSIVNVFSNPTKPTITLNGNSLYSSNPTGNQWYRNTLLIPGATSSSFIPIQSGSYTTLVTNLNNCKTESDPFSFIASGINEIESPTFQIYPNPNNGNFTLQLKNTEAKNGTITIVDMLGRTVYESLYKLNNNEGVISISQLQLKAGTYNIIIGKLDGVNSRKSFLVFGE